MLINLFHVALLGLLFLYTLARLPLCGHPAAVPGSAGHVRYGDFFGRGFGYVGVSGFGCPVGTGPCGGGGVLRLGGAA